MTVDDDVFRARLRVLRIGVDEVRLARALASVADAHVEQVARDYCISIAERSPEYRPILERHGEALVLAETAHFRHLFGGKFDQAYRDSCEATVGVEMLAQLGARVRLSIAHRTVDFLFPAIGRRHRFSVKAAIRECAAINRLFTFDVISAIAIEQRHMADAFAHRQNVLNDSGQNVEQVSRDLRNTMGEASRNLAESVTDTTMLVDEGSLSTERVAAASQEATQLIVSMAAAAEEMSASLGAIAVQTDRNLASTESAVAMSRKMTDAIEGLTEASGRIGSVVNVIASIASQTNLLALNATIEAARAGDAGRGFSVVAMEVKALAAQTANATAEIADQIERVQQATKLCTSNIVEITGQIDGISASSRSIARAVESQRETTVMVAQDAQAAAVRSDSILKGAQAVKGVMDNTLGSASRVGTAIKLLSSRMDTLGDSVSKFVVAVRQA
jgi:methyl-accepting chemotaxis protein